MPSIGSASDLGSGQAARYGSRSAWLVTHLAAATARTVASKGKAFEPNDRRKAALEAGARVVNRVADYYGRPEDCGRWEVIGGKVHAVSGCRRRLQNLWRAIEDRLRELAQSADTRYDVVVISCEGVDFIDSLGSEKLEEIVELAETYDAEVHHPAESTP